MTAKLPASVLAEGKPCPRGEAAICLLAVIGKALEKCGKEGKEAVAQEDLAKLGALQEALKDELENREGYQSRREAIAAVLAKSEEPAFEYKVGKVPAISGSPTSAMHRLTARGGSCIG